MTNMSDIIMFEPSFVKMPSRVLDSVRVLSKSWVPSVWNKTTGTLDVGDLFGHPLLTSAFPRTPVVVNKDEQSSFEDENISESFIYALHTICLHLHYRCMIQRAEYSGAQTNDFLNGILGDLSKNRSQIGIASLTVNPQRYASFGMIISQFHRSYDIIVDESHTYFDRSASIMGTLIGLYRPEAWAALLLIIVFLFFTFVLVAHLQGIIHGPSTRLRTACSIWFMKMLGSATNNCEMDLPRTYKPLTAQSFLIAIWLIWIVVIANIFQSRLPMMLASGGIRFLPFDSVETLLKTNYDIYGSRTMISAFKADKSEMYNQLGKRMKSIQADSESYPTVLLELLKTRRTAIMISSDSHIEMAKVSCDIIIAVKGLLSKAVVGMVFRKESQLKQQFQEQYSRLQQAGTIQKYDAYSQHLYRESRELRDCMPRVLPKTPSTKYTSTEITDVLFLLAFHWVFSGLASLLFLFEYTHFRMSVSCCI